MESRGLCYKTILETVDKTEKGFGKPLISRI